MLAPPCGGGRSMGGGDINTGSSLWGVRALMLAPPCGGGGSVGVGERRRGLSFRAQYLQTEKPSVPSGSDLFSPFFLPLRTRSFSWQLPMSRMPSTTETFRLRHPLRPSGNSGVQLSLKH